MLVRCVLNFASKLCCLKFFTITAEGCGSRSGSFGSRSMDHGSRKRILDLWSMDPDHWIQKIHGSWIFHFRIFWEHYFFFLDNFAAVVLDCQPYRLRGHWQIKFCLYLGTGYWFIANFPENSAFVSWWKLRTCSVEPISAVILFQIDEIFDYSPRRVDNGGDLCHWLSLWPESSDLTLFKCRKKFPTSRVPNKAS